MEQVHKAAERTRQEMDDARWALENIHLVTPEGILTLPQSKALDIVTRALKSAAGL